MKYSNIKKIATWGDKKQFFTSSVAIFVLIISHVAVDFVLGQDRYEHLRNQMKKERLIKSGIGIPDFHRDDILQDQSINVPVGIMQDVLNITKLGHWTDGPCWEMDVAGTHVYFDNGIALMVVDFSNPGSPVEMSKTVFPGRIRAIKVVGQYAYISYESNFTNLPSGVGIFDVSDPTSMEQIGLLNQVSSARKIISSDHYLFIYGGRTLYVFDISDPTDPLEVGTVDIDKSILDMVIQDSYIYVTLQYEGMAVIDISDPTQPIEIARLTLEGECNALDFRNDIVYVTSFAYNLYAIDISNPSTPQKVDSTYIRGEDIDIQDDYAYICKWGDGLQVFDIADPHNMREVGFLETHWQTAEIIVRDHRAYMANGRQGMRVYDVTNPTAPFEQGSFDTADEAKGVAAKGNNAYVADGEDGLYILDITQHDNPTILSHLALDKPESDTDRDVMDIEIRQDYALLSTVKGLYVIDISNPSNPVEIGNSQEIGYSHTTRLTIHGDWVFVASVYSGVTIFDISNIASPELLGRIDAQDGIYDVAVSGDYAFVADADTGVRCIDISDPTNPVQIGRFGDVDAVLGLDVSGTLLYVADRYDGLRILDVSDPTRPTQVGQIEGPGGDFTREVVVKDRYAYVANGYWGLWVVDVLDPSNPVMAGYYETVDDAVDVYVADEKIFMADESGGVFILEFTPQVDDSTPPYTAEHQPGKYAQNVALDANISVHIKDDTAGVDQNSIMMQINGSVVAPTITGTPTDYMVLYDPPVDFDYNQTVTVTIDASDVAGNAMTTDTYTFSTQRTSDVTAPTITIQGTATGTKGADMTVTASVVDDTRVETVMLHYRMGGASTYQSVGMTDTGTGIYTGMVPSAFVTERGVEYTISAIDTADNVSYSPADDHEASPHVVRVSFSGLDCPYQTPANSYRMISVPVDLDSKQPASVLPDDLGNHDRAEWRLIRDSAESYNEYSIVSIDHFQPGYGFWLITREADTWNVGPGQSVTTAENYSLTLAPGWNQIGNPFAFPVNWSDVDIEAGKNVEPPIGYEGTGNSTSGYRYNQSQMTPWKGYYVKNLESSAVTIGIPPVSATASSQKTRSPDDRTQAEGDWVIRIKVENHLSTDLDNYLGCLSNSEDAWDKNDFSEAPPFGDYVSLSFPHEDWDRYPGGYTGDFRSASKEGHTWDIEVRTNVKESEVRLSFAHVEDLPDGIHLILLDQDLRVSRDLRTVQDYRFISGKEKTLRHFRIVAGSDAYVETHDPGFDAGPEVFRLLQNYPNPFNASTRIQYQLPEDARVDIRILTGSGRAVRRIVENRNQATGYHNVHWNGRDDQGNPVASGIYICVLRAGAYKQSIKMLMVR